MTDEIGQLLHDIGGRKLAGSLNCHATNDGRWQCFLQRGRSNAYGMAVGDTFDEAVLKVLQGAFIGSYRMGDFGFEPEPEDWSDVADLI